MSTEKPPPLLRSRIFGELKLTEFNFPGFYAFSYAGAWPHPKFGTVEIVFKPSMREFSKWESVLTAAERRAEILVNDHDAILSTGGKQFESLFKKCGIESDAVRTVLSDLKPTCLKLISTENDELLYPPCKWFTFDLTVAVDRKFRVTNVSFDG
jgi:hypothetical protein